MVTGFLGFYTIYLKIYGKFLIYLYTNKCVCVDELYGELLQYYYFEKSLYIGTRSAVYGISKL